MCSQSHFHVSDKNEIMQTDANMQNSLTTNCQSMHNPSHDCKTDHSGFPRMKPIDMSCSKDENQCKTHDSWHQNCSNSVSQVQILFSPVQSEIVQNSEISKLTMSVATKTSKTPQNYKSIPVQARQLSAQHLCLFCNWRSLLLEPSITAQLTVVQKVSATAIYSTCPS